MCVIGWEYYRVRRLMQGWITVGFAGRELDVEKLPELETSNSRPALPRT